MKAYYIIVAITITLNALILVELMQTNKILLTIAQAAVDTLELAQGGSHEPKR